MPPAVVLIFTSGMWLSWVTYCSFVTLSIFSLHITSFWETENHNHRKLPNLTTWSTALSHSMKLWAMPCRATQDGWDMVQSSDKTWSTGEANGKPLQYFCLENPMSSMKRQKDRTLKDELPRSVGAQHATGDQWRNNFRKNEETSLWVVPGWCMAKPVQYCKVINLQLK